MVSYSIIKDMYGNLLPKLRRNHSMAEWYELPSFLLEPPEEETGEELQYET